MIDVLAGRFVREPRDGGWFDLATGRHVRVRIGDAGSRRSQIAWNDCCAEMARLRHPIFNEVVDFGMAGRSQVFEAYTVHEAPRRAVRAGSRLLAHAVRFLEARRVPLTREAARYFVRDTVPPSARAAPHPIGVILQPRAALSVLEEALGGAAAGGTVAIDVVGPSDCGLRTLQLLAARAARVAGYVTVASGLIGRLPWLREYAQGMHVCLLIDENAGAAERTRSAGFLAGLAAASARRHVALRFCRPPEQSPGAVEVEPMSVDAMSSMVFGDGDAGLPDAVLREAARRAGGHPGVFLQRIGVQPFARCEVRLSVVRESSPAYVVSPHQIQARRRGLSRILADAPERGVKLARRGRHAAAIRLLTRAARVLEARGERGLAARCAEEGGWIERTRGWSVRALEAFGRVRVLGGEGEEGIRGAIGAGVVWTDERRFTEAEAALRGACAAAGIARAVRLSTRAGLALARCFYWQQRYDEASALLTPVTGRSGDADRDPDYVEACALASRVAVAREDARKGIRMALQANEAAERLKDPRLTAIAARSMALAQAAVLDHEQVVRWVDRGTRAAGEVHLPLVSLRFRAIEMRSAARVSRAPAAAKMRAHLRAALKRRALPALLRAELEGACAACEGIAVEVPVDTLSEDRALRDLREMLTLVHGAADDGAGLDALCRSLLEDTGAATVQVVTGSPAPRTLARAGRPWTGDATAVDRILAGGAPLLVQHGTERHAAEPLRYGRDNIAVLCCRWLPGSTMEPAIVSAKLKAAALAGAATARSLLDRTSAIAAGAITDALIGTSSGASALRDAIARAARAPFPVLIEGESGSGKELVARGIHRLGSRRDRRLSTINCAALADDLLEAELFGHARGAFTGAVGERAGLFEEADGGTLFLDEVGELSGRAQAKLLRVLQDGEVRRVGENLPRRVDARIIAATNRRLDEEVAAKRFRADLRFRLDVVRIAVPPLRERASDIPALAQHFWAEAAGRVGSSATLTPETLTALSRYDWPGNVRELQNAIAALAVHAPRRGRVPPAILPAHIAGAVRSAATSFDAARQEFERRYVRAALAQAAGHRSRAARALGVSRQGLAKMLRRLGIEA